MSQPETWDPGVIKFRRLTCLECGAVMDAAASPDHPGEIANPGDLCVCGSCGAVMMFGEDLTPRGMTEPEMSELIEDTETMNMLARNVARVHLFRAEPETEQIQ